MEHPTRPAPATGLTRGLRWAPLGIVAFWLVVMAALYGLMTLVLKPPPVTVSANGDLSILRARDGHFYANGTVNGHPVRFLVDTGATTVGGDSDRALLGQNFLSRFNITLSGDEMVLRGK